MLLDTGANVSVISPGTLGAAGYDLDHPIGEISMTTVNSTGHPTQLFRVAQLSALACDRQDLVVACLDLQGGLEFGGLLGLDFLAGRVLVIDFVNFTVNLS